jgi:hypothetical protein
VTYSQFLQAFPRKDQVDQSNVYFRFRREDSLTDFVWVDVRDPQDTLPVYGGVITTKILRLDASVMNKRKIILRRKTIIAGQAENDSITAQVKAKLSGQPTPVADSAPKLPPKPTRTTSTGSAGAPNRAPSPQVNSSPAQPPKTASPGPATVPKPTPAAPPTPPAARTANLLDGDDGIDNAFNQPLDRPLPLRLHLLPLPYQTSSKKTIPSPLLQPQQSHRPVAKLQPVSKQTAVQRHSLPVAVTWRISTITIQGQVPTHSIAQN